MWGGLYLDVGRARAPCEEDTSSMGGGQDRPSLDDVRPATCDDVRRRATTCDDVRRRATTCDDVRRRATTTCHAAPHCPEEKATFSLRQGAEEEEQEEEGAS